MRSHLKVKVFTLSAEMTYIRRQEEKWKDRARYARQKQKAAGDISDRRSLEYSEKQFWSHQWHRYSLKAEARVAHLAYGFFRGIPYASMENICYGDMSGMGSSAPNWEAVTETVTRFIKDEENPQDIMQRYAEWLSDAKVWYETNPQRIQQLDAERPARIEALKAAKVPYTKPQRGTM